MAMLASKPSMPSGAHSAHYAPSSMSFHRTQTANSTTSQDGLFTSPTESEFSDIHDSAEAVRSWDEKKVGEWLRSIRCGQYEPLFQANNLNGDNLLDCDQKILQEIGIKKVGDRVRIFVAVKNLRSKSAASRRKRNRDSFTAGHSQAGLSSDSPRNVHSRTQQNASNRRWSRQVDPSALHAFSTNGTKSSSRPSSPLASFDGRGVRAHRFATSPAENPRKESSGAGYFSPPSSASTSSARRPETPSAVPQSARIPTHRQNQSIELTMGSLPAKPVVRVIYRGGQTKVIDVGHCKTSEEILLTVLRKLTLPETHWRNYCFYVLDGLDPDPANCRRLSDGELVRICDGSNKSERNRLILRKINAGDPDIDEVRRAAQLALDETQVLHNHALNSNNSRNMRKVQQLTGEPWSNMKQPLSPITATDRSRNHSVPMDDIEAPEIQPPPKTNTSGGSAKIRQFFGTRPPSELIMSELTSYFPSQPKDNIEKTMRLSVRRSQRMSRAASHLSVISNASYASSLKDAPPIPSIADQWLNQGEKASRASRPLSVSKFNLPQTAFRDSIVSSSLQPLQEESPVEPNRKSYVSFDSGSDSANAAGEADAPKHSFFDESVSVNGRLSSDAGGSFQERLSMIVAEDGEEEDTGLTNFLAGNNNFENENWMKGNLIGEGSFGSVYIALHAITGELMAVKQVELPNVAKGSEIDKKKNNMISALKHEIDLLQGLQHPNIVQYLGTSCDDNYLNIFLEYVPGGSIAMMLKQYNNFNEPLVRNFTRQILHGLAYLHGRNIIHRDIKGANVLVDNHGGVKISDFGISKRVEASTMLGQNAGGGHIHRPSLQGSVFWMAPEVVKQSAHTKKADIWSLGCLIVEMFSGVHPFPNCSQLQAIFQIGSMQARPTMPEKCGEEAKRFLDLTFELEHEKRPSAEELLRHRFLAPMA
ncbi:MAG: hypothetical protein Q9227_007351 [Pyrenula ochraceoflavens]